VCKSEQTLADSHGIVTIRWIASLYFTKYPSTHEIASFLAKMMRLIELSFQLSGMVLPFYGGGTMRDDNLKSSIKLLVVDDAPSIRSSISGMLAEIGYIVRTAGDGLEALVAIRMDGPNILLSDLNMPGMSGFELLRVVRLRYPSIQVIAMSGSFSGEEVPSGVIADAFYQKGCSIRSLLRIIEGLSQQKLRPVIDPVATAPLRIQRNGIDSFGSPYATIVCPECLRSFHETVSGSLTSIREAHCSHCHQSIYYVIVDPVEWESAMPSIISSSMHVAQARI
jgi:CheY-like chemotaxis protein